MSNRLLVLGAAVIVASACSGMTVNQDFMPGTDFSGFRAVGWMPGDFQTGADALTDQKIRVALESGFQAKGFRLVSSAQADLVVAYQLILNDQTDYQTVNTGYGGGWGYGMYGARYGVGMSSSTTRAITYTMGTLVVDLFDAKSKELVWRGTAEGKINESATPQQRQERANEAVARILEQFPPKG